MCNKERIKFWKDEKIIAIDPGKSGGIVIYSIDRNIVIEVIKMPDTPLDILNYISMYSQNSICYIEKVGGIPGKGGASSMFNFGKGFGYLEMGLICKKIPTITVTPQKWQKELQLGGKGEKTSTEWKNKLKAKAQQLYPGVGKITLATADALLILEYARIIEKRK